MNKQPTRDEHSEIRALLGVDKRHVSRVLTRRLSGWTGLAALSSSCCLPLRLFSAAARAPSKASSWSRASRADLTVVITATGSVQPTKQVDVSSELSGTVRHVFVDYNSPVKVSQVLAELDTDKLKATLNSSRARLASAKAKVLVFRR
jgi:HlyD family secretion protein